MKEMAAEFKQMDEDAEAAAAAEEAARTQAMADEKATEKRMKIYWKEQGRKVGRRCCCSASVCFFFCVIPLIPSSSRAPSIPSRAFLSLAAP